MVWSGLPHIEPFRTVEFRGGRNGFDKKINSEKSRDKNFKLIPKPKIPGFLQNPIPKIPRLKLLIPLADDIVIIIAISLI